MAKDLECLDFLGEKTIRELELFFINTDISSKDRNILIDFIKRANNNSSKREEK